MRGFFKKKKKKKKNKEEEKKNGTSSDAVRKAKRRRRMSLSRKHRFFTLDFKKEKKKEENGESESKAKKKMKKKMKKMMKNKRLEDRLAVATPRHLRSSPGDRRHRGRNRNKYYLDNLEQWNKTLRKAEERKRSKNVSTEPMYTELENLVGSYDIHEACRNDKVLMVYDLCKQNRDLNAQNGDQNTPLHFSCALGRKLCVKELLKHPDVDASCQNISGETALHVACRAGVPEIVELLLRNGRCDPKEKTRDNKVAMELARNEKVEKVIINQQKLDQEFIMSVTNKNAMKVEELLERGANINTTTFRPGNEKGKFVKKNALEILFCSSVTKKLDRDGDLIRLLVNRGCKIKKEVSAITNSKYSELLREGYLRGKRFPFLRELIQTEKVYHDDLLITFNLFYFPLLKGKKSKGTENHAKILNNIKDEQFKERIVTMFELLKEIHKENKKVNKAFRIKFEDYCALLNRNFGATDESRSRELKKKEIEVIKCLFNMDLETYKNFLFHQQYMSGWIFEKKEYSELAKFYRQQEQKIPFPRIRDNGFVSMLSKIRNRLFKYQGFLECLIKNTDRNLSKEYISTLGKLLEKIKTGLERINSSAGDIQNKKQMFEIHELFKEKYDLNMIVQNPNRKYICHQTGFKALNMSTRSTQTCDLFVFSDSIFFGSQKGKKQGYFEFYWYKQFKFSWTFHDDFYRLLVYKPVQDGGDKVLDYVVGAPKGQNQMWYKQMKNFFQQNQRGFYWQHVFLQCAFSMDKELEEFRKNKRFSEVEDDDDEDEDEGEEGESDDDDEEVGKKKKRGNSKEEMRVMEDMLSVFQRREEKAREEVTKYEKKISDLKLRIRGLKIEMGQPTSPKEKRRTRPPSLMIDTRKSEKDDVHQPVVTTPVRVSLDGENLFEKHLKNVEIEKQKKKTEDEEKKKKKNVIEM